MPAVRPLVRKSERGSSNAVASVSSKGTSNLTTKRTDRPRNSWIVFWAALSNVFANSRGTILPLRKVLTVIISRIWRFLTEQDKGPFVYLAWQFNTMHRIRMRNSQRVLAKEAKEEARKKRRALAKDIRKDTVQKHLESQAVVGCITLAVPPYLLSSSTAVGLMPSDATSAQRMLPHPTMRSPGPPQKYLPGIASSLMDVSSTNGPMHNTFIHRNQFGPQSGLAMTHSQLPRINTALSFSNDSYLGHAPISKSPPPLSFASIFGSEGLKVRPPMTAEDPGSLPLIRTAAPADWEGNIFESNVTRHVNAGDWASRSSNAGSSSWDSTQAHDSDDEKTIHKSHLQCLLSFASDRVATPPSVQPPSVIRVKKNSNDTDGIFAGTSVKGEWSLLTTTAGNGNTGQGE
ncbi:hypothetical protein AAF712_009971 [Marasmius tenuissimus]|uniref:Uncharacterized protein n=1 Tax=Marasmius tenuissimus TaxID=585030 RepID=A0ABR2ZS63_9AGAR